VAATPNWTQQSPATSPTSRAFGHLANDPSTNQTVFFGGWDGSQDVADTWLWNGSSSSWVKQSPVTSPPARELGGLAYSGGSQLLLFGGFEASANKAVADTWAWTGTNWTKMSPSTHPSARFGMGMAYDAATNQLIMFGGQKSLANSFTGLADTWKWTGTTWQQLSPATRPPARSYFAMGYDASSQQLVMFGGAGRHGALADTWVWTGTNWVKQHPATSPPARYASTMTFDSAQAKLILFGGTATTGTFPQATFSDTWVWNGSTWKNGAPATTPPARAFEQMTFDASSSHVVLFGGVATINNRFGDGPQLGDTWIYG
jgi:N-acetylneuraminic acid mutarotase